MCPSDANDHFVNNVWNCSKTSNKPNKTNHLTQREWWGPCLFQGQPSYVYQHSKEVTNHLPNLFFSENITSTRFIYGERALKIGQKYITRYINSQEIFSELFLLSVDVKVKRFELQKNKYCVQSFQNKWLSLEYLNIIIISKLKTINIG